MDVFLTIVMIPVGIAVVVGIRLALMNSIRMGINVVRATTPTARQQNRDWMESQARINQMIEDGMQQAIEERLQQERQRSQAVVAEMYFKSVANRRQLSTLGTVEQTDRRS